MAARVMDTAPLSSGAAGLLLRLTAEGVEFRRDGEDLLVPPPRLPNWPPSSTTPPQRPSDFEPPSATNGTTDGADHAAIPSDTIEALAIALGEALALQFQQDMNGMDNSPSGPAQTEK